jgi:DNA-directed RNA polymerase subunit L
MKIKILNSSKNEAEFEIENLTLAELLRVYLNKDDSVEMAAWKRVHLFDKPIFKLITKGKTPKKAINDAVSKVIKDLDKIEDDFKKMI